MWKSRSIPLTILRLLLAWLAAVGIEGGNFALGQKTFVLPLEILPAGAFLAGVLCGWPGIVGWTAGITMNNVIRLLQFPSPGEEIISWFALPITYALLGIAGYLVFRHVDRIGRGFPNLRSVLALIAAAVVGGASTAVVASLLFPWDFSVRGTLVYCASNFASILTFSPLVMLLAGRIVQPLLVAIPNELAPEKPFPENLRIQPPKSSVPLTFQLTALALGLVASTALVIVLRQNPEAGSWALLTYLSLIIWSAISFGLRGGLLSASLTSILYLTARSYTDADYLPNDADIYSIGLYAEMLVCFAVAVALGAGREAEVRRRQVLHREPVLTTPERSFTHGNVDVSSRDVPRTEPRKRRGSESYDVFLSYNTQDDSRIREIVDALRERDIFPWIADSEVQPGRPWQPVAEDQIRRIPAAAVFVGPGGLSPWQRVEVGSLLLEFAERGCPVIPVILPGCSQAPPLPTFLAGMQWVDFRQSEPDPLARLIWGITGEPPSEAAPEPRFADEMTRLLSQSLEEAYLRLCQWSSKIPPF